MMALIMLAIPLADSRCPILDLTLPYSHENISYGAHKNNDVETDVKERLTYHYDLVCSSSLSAENPRDGANLLIVAGHGSRSVCLDV